MWGSNNNKDCVLSSFLFQNIDSFLLSLIYNNGFVVSTKSIPPRSIAGGQRLIRCDGATDRPYYYFVFNCDNKFRLFSLFLLLIWGAKVIGLKRILLQEVLFKW